ncbi:polymorphic toxin type 23 domain-containing protein, partial [Sinomicrobium oceani]|uniref:polymorphic toxin type 23 domain-containing protein n=1 Tax=Sinomicrobium oceani TaxID=1150368 RepID=UPI00227AC3C3
EIHEQGKERINFQYNASMGRAHMYYGGEESDKMQRRYRKHYSADGSMEIREDTQSGKTTFITYIGGDAYSAPLIWHSDQGTTTTNNYYYLHRDYLGSILSITDKNGTVKEKRHFDAWGNIVKLTNGSGTALNNFTILDRGYTGHEHLAGVGLVHMNGRLYDPVMHRFLMPDNYVQDPFNTQNFNRYGYVLNNPLMYVDQNGEFFFVAALVVGAIVGAVAGGAAYVANAIKTGNWNWGQFGMSILGGAVVGAVSAAVSPASMVAVSIGKAALGGFVGGLMPSANVSMGNWNLSISPAIAFGKGIGVGGNFSIGFNDGNFSASAGFGISYYGSAHGSGASGWEYRKSWSVGGKIGNNELSVYSTKFSGFNGQFDQKVGGFSYRNGDFGFRYENDGTPFSGWSGDGGDSFRSAAVQLSYKDYSVGFNLFTGKREYVPGEDSPPQVGSNQMDDYGRRYPNGFVKEVGTPYRLGALTFGYKGFRAGVDSEHIRHAIQDQAIHNLNILGVFDKRQPGFRNQSWNWKPYFQYQSPNSYSLW